MELPVDPRLLIALGILLVLVTVAKTAVSRKSKKAVSYPYVSAESLFSKNEQAFLRVLKQAAGDYLVFGKVRLADVVEVRKGVSKSEWQRAFDRISQKHLDFVLLRPHDFSVWCAVELDDATHKRAERKSRDVLLEKALTAAEVPLVRVPSRRTYDVAEIRALLDTQTTLKAA